MPRCQQSIVYFTVFYIRSISSAPTSGLPGRAFKHHMSRTAHCIACSFLEGKLIRKLGFARLLSVYFPSNWTPRRPARWMIDLDVEHQRYLGLIFCSYTTPDRTPCYQNRFETSVHAPSNAPTAIFSSIFSRTQPLLPAWTTRVPWPAYILLLELRQYKNEFVSVKRMLALKLPPFFPCRVGDGKRAAISKQTCFSQKRVRSYIVLALESKFVWQQ